jgi:hypothetical protein
MMRKVVPLGLILLGCLICGLGLASPGWGQPFMVDGSHWSEISYDAKVAYVKGVGNMADFECQAAVSKKGRSFCLGNTLVQELKDKTIDTVVKEIDQYYKENQDKIKTSVIEVLLRRASKLCPPETTK